MGCECLVSRCIGPGYCWGYCWGPEMKGDDMADYMYEFRGVWCFRHRSCVLSKALCAPPPRLNRWEWKWVETRKCGWGMCIMEPGGFLWLLHRL